MIRMQYPDFQFKLKDQQGKRLIFDALRKVWLKLTPEEWVRQHITGFLIQTMGYPATLIAQEKKIILGELVKRFDILVYDQHHDPWMMIECKAGTIALSPDVLDQVLRYNLAVPVDYLVITNGNEAMVFHKTGGTLQALDAFPAHPATASAQL